MNNHLNLRTFIVITIIIAFAWAISPLKPRDFYNTFRNSLNDKSKEQGEIIINEAKKLQEKRADLLPSAALLQVADSKNIELKEIAILPDALDNSESISILRKKAASSIRLGLDLNGGVEFILRLNPDFESLAENGMSKSEAKKKLNENFDIYRDLAIDSLRKRLEAQGIFESEIVPAGSQNLSLKVPIVSKDEKEKLRKLISMSSKLEFRLVHRDNDNLLRSGAVTPLGYELMEELTTKENKNNARKYYVAIRTELTGKAVDEAMVSKNQFGQISIALRFNQSGADDFAKITGENINRQLAIVLDDKLYCAPNISSAIIGGNAEISGQFSVEEATLISDALTNGSFPFKIDVLAVYDTDPTLGADNVQNGIWAGILALCVLALFMCLYYHRAGVVACVALVINIVLILGAMATFGATMTMPGIAGIILTLGMAVDANVLVFERMREEREAGKSPSSIISLGFQKAYSSVIDGNLTTLIVAVILMYFGTGAIKGFAVSLTIGIMSSLFTALFMTHVIFDWMLKLSNPTFKMKKLVGRSSINFIKQFKIALTLSLIAIFLSLAICFYKGSNMLSVDFTGGTLISFNYKDSVPVTKIENTLLENNIDGKAIYKSNAAVADNKKIEILIRENSSNSEEKNLTEKVFNILNSKYPELKLSVGQTTIVGSLVGTEMTKSAIIALFLAFLGIIIYVSIRFEFQYAIAGILALVHDVIIGLGIFVLFGRELSLGVVAGLLTIVGYSINDTIVIFDRIREEKRLNPTHSLPEIINSSINNTLSRTILTSLTTFIVVIIMFALGGIAINDFIFIIMLGIIIGTYSSIYVASALVIIFSKMNKNS